MKKLSVLIVLSSMLALNTMVLAMPGMGEQKSAQRIHGKVVNLMDTSNYTYVQIDTGSKKYWAAGPKTQLTKGSMIAIDTGMPFKDFESKELKKKFDTVYFVNRFISDRPQNNKNATNPHSKTNHAEAEIIKGIKKLKNGKSVDEVIKDRKSLAGKSVQVRGKVIKYTPKVMGKNWLHIKDSSSVQKLIVSTDQEVKIGGVVIVKGVVAIDRDLGYGYKYEVMIERAIISQEK